MSTALEEIRNNRIKKLGELKNKGINPYPERVVFDIKEISEVSENFKKLSKSKKAIGIAGRVMGLRGHGGSAFLDIFDGSTPLTAGGSGKFQAFVGRDKIGEEQFSIFSDTVDIGDFIAISGKPFVTKRKEPTIEVSKWQMLAKSLRPLPEKWHGLSDVEERFRKRYLDTLMNPEVKDKFVLRSKIISELRNFLDKEGFMEVETPILQTLAGGASARPFKTHHNALDIDLNLRIATEIHLKELLIAGFKKVYEIGRIFRNEGIDMTHNPEFTSVEIYEAYENDETLMKFIEKLISSLVKSVFKKNKISFEEKEITFKPPFRKITFLEALERHALITDYHKKTLDDLIMFAQRFGIKTEDHESKDKIADKIFAKVCRPKFWEPTFVTNYPANLIPLAKRSSQNHNTSLAFQLVIGGVEVAKAFNELNDPIDQRERFKKESELAKSGDIEAQPMDEEFIEAMEYGMPPAAGVGIGIDRLVMLLTNTTNVKEVILFPTMKPK